MSSSAPLDSPLLSLETAFWPLPKLGSQEYDLHIHTESAVGNWLTEQQVRQRLRKEWLRATPQGGAIYRLSLLSFAQYPPTGLLALAGEAAQLRRELEIETDAHGRLLQVLNKATLREQWEPLRPNLLRKYADSNTITSTMVHNLGAVLHGDGYLEDVLRPTSEFRLLLPALYGRALHIQPTQWGVTIVPRAIGSVDLPLHLLAQLRPAPPGVYASVLLEGELDEDHYRAADVGRAVQALTGRPDADPSLAVTYAESFELDAAGQVLAAAQLTAYAVPGALKSQTVATLSLVSTT